MAMLEINKIHCGDCLDMMKKLPDNCVDLVLTDPPYNAKNIGPKQRRYNIGIMQLPQEEYIKFCKDWFKEADRISKAIIFTPGISNTHNYPQPNWQICWHKPAAVSFNRYGGFNAWETIFCYGKNKGDDRLGQDYLLFNTLNFNKGPEKNHPCPKPLGLIIKLIKIFSKEGDLVLDPFIGSGTTAVACQNLHRNFIGIEISPEYCEIARKRLEQQPLF